MVTPAISVWRTLAFIPLVAPLVALALSAGACGGPVARQQPEPTDVGGQAGAGGQAGMTGTGGAPAADDAGSGGQGTGGALPGNDAADAPAEAPSPPADAPATDAGPPPSGSAALEDPLPACARSVAVTDSAGLTAAIAAAKPGDCLVLADGDYRFGRVAVDGTPTQPIVIRAANRGQARVSTGGIEIAGSTHLVIEGLLITSGGSISFSDSSYARLSRTRLNPTTDRGGAWINMTGRDTHHLRVDRNDMGPQTAVGNMVQAGVAVPGQVVQYIQIDRNLFHDIRYSGGNGWEAIRAGYSHVAPSKGYIVIERNLFRGASGDPETISVKSSDAVVRYNTFRATNGQICLRHGNRTRVHGNFMLNSGSGGQGSIRVYGADHKIFNNYLVSSGAINLAAGSADGTETPGTEHYRVYRTEVVNNTVVGAGVSIGGSLAPVGCTVANNIVQGGGIDTGGQNTKVMGNLTNGGGMMMVGGMWRLVAGSPAIDASLPGFDYVTEDMDGDKRVGKPDLGADELSTEMPLRGPLVEKDVGPDAP